MWIPQICILSKKTRYQVKRKKPQIWEDVMTKEERKGSSSIFYLLFAVSYAHIQTAVTDVLVCDSSCHFVWHRDPVDPADGTVKIWIHKQTQKHADLYPTVKALSVKRRAVGSFTRCRDRFRSLVGKAVVHRNSQTTRLGKTLTDSNLYLRKQTWTKHLCLQL